MKSLVIMGMAILMGISSIPLNNMKNIEDSNLNTIESADTTGIEETETADFDNETVQPETNEEQTTYQAEDANVENVLDCKEIITEEFFDEVESVKSTNSWKWISKQGDIDKLKNALWMFKLRESEPYEEMVLGGIGFSFKCKDGTEKQITISGQKLGIGNVWYDIVNNSEVYEAFNEQINLLYPAADPYGEDVLDCKELLSEEFFENAEEVSCSYSNSILKKEKEIEKFKNNIWLFKVRKSEKADSKKSDSLVFNIKSEDGSKKQIVINEESMIIDGESYDIVNYYEVLITFMEEMDKLFVSED